MKSGVVASHSFFQNTSFFWMNQLEPSIPSCRVIYLTVVATHFFRGYMEQVIFDRSYLLRIATFLEELFRGFDFLKGSLFILPL